MWMSWAKCPEKCRPLRTCRSSMVELNAQTAKVGNKASEIGHTKGKSKTFCARLKGMQLSDKTGDSVF